MAPKPPFLHKKVILDTMEFSTPEGEREEIPLSFLGIGRSSQLFDLEKKALNPPSLKPSKTDQSKQVMPPSLPKYQDSAVNVPPPENIKPGLTPANKVSDAPNVPQTSQAPADINAKPPEKAKSPQPEKPKYKFPIKEIPEGYSVGDYIHHIASGQVGNFIDSKTNVEDPEVEEFIRDYADQLATLYTPGHADEFRKVAESIKANRLKYQRVMEKQKEEKAKKKIAGDAHQLRELKEPELVPNQPAGGTPEEPNTTDDNTPSNKPTVQRNVVRGEPLQRQSTDTTVGSEQEGTKLRNNEQERVANRRDTIAEENNENRDTRIGGIEGQTQLADVRNTNLIPNRNGNPQPDENAIPQEEDIQDVLPLTPEEQAEYEQNHRDRLGRELRGEGGSSQEQEPVNPQAGDVTQLSDNKDTVVGGQDEDRDTQVQTVEERNKDNKLPDGVFTPQEEKEWQDTLNKVMKDPNNEISTNDASIIKLDNQQVQQNKGWLSAIWDYVAGGGQVKPNAQGLSIGSRLITLLKNQAIGTTDYINGLVQNMGGGKQVGADIAMGVAHLLQGVFDVKLVDPVSDICSFVLGKSAIPITQAVIDNIESLRLEQEAYRKKRRKLRKQSLTGSTQNVLNAYLGIPIQSPSQTTAAKTPPSLAGKTQLQPPNNAPGKTQVHPQGKATKLDNSLRLDPVNRNKLIQNIEDIEKALTGRSISDPKKRKANEDRLANMDDQELAKELMVNIDIFRKRYKLKRKGNPVAEKEEIDKKIAELNKPTKKPINQAAAPVLTRPNNPNVLTSDELEKQREALRKFHAQKSEKEANATPEEKEQLAKEKADRREAEILSLKKNQEKFYNYLSKKAPHLPPEKVEELFKHFTSVYQDAKISGDNAKTANEKANKVLEELLSQLPPPEKVEEATGGVKEPPKTKIIDVNNASAKNPLQVENSLIDYLKDGGKAAVYTEDGKETPIVYTDEGLTYEDGNPVDIYEVLQNIEQDETGKQRIEFLSGVKVPTDEELKQQREKLRQERKQQKEKEEEDRKAKIQKEKEARQYNYEQQMKEKNRRKQIKNQTNDSMKILAGEISDLPNNDRGNIYAEHKDKIDQLIFGGADPKEAINQALDESREKAQKKRDEIKSTKERLKAEKDALKAKKEGMTKVTPSKNDFPPYNPAPENAETTESNEIPDVVEEPVVSQGNPKKKTGAILEKQPVAVERPKKTTGISPKAQKEAERSKKPESLDPPLRGFETRAVQHLREQGLSDEIIRKRIIQNRADEHQASDNLRKVVGGPEILDRIARVMLKKTGKNANNPETIQRVVRHIDKVYREASKAILAKAGKVFNKKDVHDYHNQFVIELARNLKRGRGFVASAKLAYQEIGKKMEKKKQEKISQSGQVWDFLDSLPTAESEEAHSEINKLAKEYIIKKMDRKEAMWKAMTEVYNKWLKKKEAVKA